MGKQTDALVGVDGALGFGRAAGGAGGCLRTAGGGWWYWIWTQETQLGALRISQTHLGEGLVELDGGTVHLKHVGYTAQHLHMYHITVWSTT